MDSKGVRDFYTNKNVLITGVTEFLGKVILEKILRTIPNVGKIYLLIRSKEGSSFGERFKREVISSPCFEMLKKSMKGFDQFIQTKLVIFPGLLVKEGLGLSEELRNELIENVNVIIHCAATADFNARLDDAVKINVRGPMEILAFAKQMKRLENFVYASTCYVNSDKRGVIEEKIYPTEQDPDILLQEIEKIPSLQVVPQTSSIIGNFPNTLTFTFNLCERLLDKHRENLPLTIVRLSIIGAAWRDPFPGWVEKVTMAGALYLLGGIGLLKVLKGDPKIVGDQIPVDFCSNAIIVAGARYARSPNLTVVHCATSANNPVSWGYSTEVVCSYWKNFPPQKRVGECNFHLQKNEKLLKAEQFARRAPALVFQKFAFAVDKPGLKKSASKSYNAILRSEQLSEQFKHFTLNEWIFTTKNLEDMRQFCTEEEKEIFQLDVTTIEWKRYLLTHAWGLHKYILKENVEPPQEFRRSDLLMSTGKGTLANIKFVLSKDFSYRPKSLLHMKDAVLNSQKVRDVVKDIVINKKIMNLGDQQFEEHLMKIAARDCDFIFSNYTMSHIRMFVFLVHTVFKRIYEKVVVDENLFATMKNHDYNTYGPLIFMPTHRSYVDFLLVSYVLYCYNTKVPQIVAAEDFLGMAMVATLMRKSGAFFIRRKRAEFPEIYNAILYEYIQQLLMDQNWLEFFVEGTRSRYGKTLAPKSGIMTIITDAVLDKKIPDAHIVPITINYDRVLEGETFPYELLGEQKVKESLSRVVKGVSILNMNFGKVYIDVCQPFSIKKYIENHVAKNPESADLHENRHKRSPINKQLGFEVVYQLNENLVAMPTALISSIILLHRKGISEENLHNKVEWLVDQLYLRKVKVGALEGRYTPLFTENAVSLLGELVTQKKDILQIQLAAKQDYKNILLLSYYRNTIIHAFWNESIIACALSSFGQDVAWKEGVPLERLYEEVAFLNVIVNKEYQLREKITPETFPQLIERMTQRGILEIVQNGQAKVRVAQTGGDMMSFLCHLIWPFLESYWVTTVYLFSIRNRTTNTLQQKFIQEVQWFAESIHDERIIEFYEACSLDTIKNAFTVFKDMKVISVTKKISDRTNANEDVVELILSEEKLKAMEEHVKKFLKDSFAKSVNSPIELARKSVLLDYPFMAKM